MFHGRRCFVRLAQFLADLFRPFGRYLRLYRPGCIILHFPVPPMCGEGRVGGVVHFYIFLGQKGWCAQRAMANFATMIAPVVVLRQNWLARAYSGSLFYMFSRGGFLSVAFSALVGPVK